MTEPDLRFVSGQLNRILNSQRDMRNEMHIIRGEMQIIRSALNRIDDTLNMDILDRIRKLEEK